MKRLFFSLLLPISVWAQQKQQPYLDYLKLDLKKGGVQADLSEVIPYQKLRIGGTPVNPADLPKGLKNTPEGLIIPQFLTVKTIHRFPIPEPTEKWPHTFTRDGYKVPEVYADCPRMAITPRGDYLLTVIGGKQHYGGLRPSDKVNDIFLYRSPDRGRTWLGPYLGTLGTTYNHHGWVPLTPKSGRRMYVFSTEPREGDFGEGQYMHQEDAGIGMRYSDDDGYTWSAVTRISPVNDPGFQGMWVIKGAETAKGTWLMAPHSGQWVKKISEPNPVVTQQYIFRSTDQGKTWEVLPGPRPTGWTLSDTKRLEEGRVIVLKDGQILLFCRSQKGVLYRLESKDDGKTWSIPAPTTLVHPDAPPMLGTLTDGQTLVALHHNRRPAPGFGNGDDRSELWASTSTDAGLTWSEPRFLAASSVISPKAHARIPNLTYADVVADRGILNIFIPHLWRQVVYIQLNEADLLKLPTKADLFPAARPE